jgi:hypothetical protein
VPVNVRMGNQVVHVHAHAPRKSGGTAAVLEVIFALFLQAFGVGHIYGGHILAGLFLMFGWWAFLFVSVILAYLTLGLWLFVLGFAWFVLMILSPIVAASWTR